MFLENLMYSALVWSVKKLHYPPGNHCHHCSDWLWRRSVTHVTSQIQYRGNGARYIAMGYVVVRSFQSVEIVGRLLSSVSLDKVVLFRRQFLLGNHMSKMPRLIFWFLEHISYTKWFLKGQWDFWMGKFLYDPGGVALRSGLQYSMEHSIF